MMEGKGWKRIGVGIREIENEEDGDKPKGNCCEDGDMLSSKGGITGQSPRCSEMEENAAGSNMGSGSDFSSDVVEEVCPSQVGKNDLSKGISSVNESKTITLAGQREDFAEEVIWCTPLAVVRPDVFCEQELMTQRLRKICRYG